MTVREIQSKTRFDQVKKWYIRICKKTVQHIYNLCKIHDEVAHADDEQISVLQSRTQSLRSP